jgi:uncharacterized protein (TIGR02271 family)
MAKTVVALYEELSQAQRAVKALREKGFDANDISVVASDSKGEFTRFVGKEGEFEEIKDGAAAGAGIGAVLGGLGGLLVGLGALAIPGIGPALAAGPIVSALAGAGIGAAAGGLVGALVDMGIPDDQAEMYAEGVRRGGTLVVVTTSDRNAETAVDILNRFNPVDIERRAVNWRSKDWRGFDKTATPYTPQQIELERKHYAEEIRDQGETTFPVVEEEMRVGKREVQTGGVRVHTFVTEKPFEETVNLREEHVEVERHPADRPASRADLEAFQEGTFEVTETAEEAVTDKQARVVEEVEISKDVEERQETVRDTLRRKDVDVEHMETTGFEEYEPMFRQHFETTYSAPGYNYTTYQPAYRYGYELASSDRYRGRRWEEIEAEARRDWEARHRDSAWEDFKEAVRQGWATVTGRR